MEDDLTRFIATECASDPEFAALWALEPMLSNISQLNSWIHDDDFDGELSVDNDMRIWAPTYDNRDAICGGHVVGQVPAAQAYHWRVVNFIEYRKGIDAFNAAYQDRIDQDQEPF